MEELKWNHDPNIKPLGRVIQFKEKDHRFCFRIKPTSPSKRREIIQILKRTGTNYRTIPVIGFIDIYIGR